MPSPSFDDHLGLCQRVEDLTVQQLIAKLPVEALDVAVLPRTARHNVGGLGADRRDPLAHGLGHELRPVARQELGIGMALMTCGAEGDAGGQGPATDL